MSAEKKTAEPKHLLASKNFWGGLAIIALPFLKDVQQLLTDYPQAVSVLGLLIIVLRFFTGQPVTLSQVRKVKPEEKPAEAPAEKPGEGGDASEAAGEDKPKDDSGDAAE